MATKSTHTYEGKNLPTKYIETLKQKIYQQKERFKNLIRSINKQVQITYSKILEKLKDISKKKKYTKIQLEADKYLQINAPILEKLEDISKKTKYTQIPLEAGKYWEINDTIFTDKIQQDLIKKRSINYYDKISQGEIIIKHYNVTSEADIHERIWETYKNKSSAFKINIAFGYITENIETKLHCFYDPIKFFFTSLPVIRQRSDIENLLRDLTKDNIVNFIARNFPDTKHRLIGIFIIKIKTFDLGYPIGSPINIPKYIAKNRSIITLNDIENNLCFWGCLALMDGARRDRYIKKAKEFFIKFYGSYNPNYLGFDYINELDRLEETTPFAINIILFEEDHTISYVRRSTENEKKYQNTSSSMKIISAMLVTLRNWRKRMCVINVEQKLGIL